MRTYSIRLLLLAVTSCILAAATPASADLVAHWQFEGNYIDATGNGHDGTAVGNPVILNDPARGQVLEVDGDDRIRILDAPDLNYASNQSMTLTAWANYEPIGAPAGVGTVGAGGQALDARRLSSVPLARGSSHARVAVATLFTKLGARPGRFSRRA